MGIIANKRGDFFIFFLSILMIVVYVYIGIRYTELSIRWPYNNKVVGDIESKIISASMESERRLFFIEQSSRYAADESILEMAENGGINEKDLRKCLDHEKGLWNKDCFQIDDLGKNFLTYFNKNFERYKKRILELYGVNINDKLFEVDIQNGYFTLGYDLEKEEKNYISIDKFGSYGYSLVSNISVDYSFGDYFKVYNDVIDCSKGFNINVGDQDEKVLNCIKSKSYSDIVYEDAIKKDKIVVRFETDQERLNDKGELEGVKIEFIADLEDLSKRSKVDVGELYQKVEIKYENNKNYLVKEGDGIDRIISENYIRNDKSELTQEDINKIKDEIKEINKIEELKVDNILILPNLGPDFIFKVSKYRKVIIIDPGHGGEDSGAKVKLDDKDIYESTINLDIATDLRDLLLKDYDVYLTRSKDQDINLEYRSKYANDFKDRDAILISLHVNSFGEPGTNGYAQPCDKTGMLVFYSESSKTDSRKLAEKLQDSLYKVYGQSVSAVVEDDLFMIRNSQIPSALVELGFICNEDELRRLLDESNKEIIVRAINDAVNGYFALPV